MMLNIGKSGTGIGKSGTGIGKRGAASGVRLRLAAAAMMLAAVQAVAGPNLLINAHGDNVVIALHDGGDVVLGAAAVTGAYQVFALYPAMSLVDDDGAIAPLVKGSGSGSAGFVDPNDDHGLHVKGSGSGVSSDSSCGSGAGLMVKGSGSGASTASNHDDGAGLMVKGSGSGASSEASGCRLPVGGWGVAEVVVDPAGMHVMIHRSGERGLSEYLMAFKKTTHGTLSGTGRPDFVAVP